MEAIDNAALRRELRRKKILENAEKRMNKIFGKKEDGNEGAVPTINGCQTDDRLLRRAEVVVTNCSNGVSAPLSEATTSMTSTADLPSSTSEPADFSRNTYAPQNIDLPTLDLDDSSEDEFLKGLGDIPAKRPSVTQSDFPKKLSSTRAFVRSPESSSVVESFLCALTASPALVTAIKFAAFWLIALITLLLLSMDFVQSAFVVFVPLEICIITARYTGFVQRLTGSWDSNRGRILNAVLMFSRLPPDTIRNMLTAMSIMELFVGDMSVFLFFLITTSVVKWQIVN